MKKEHFYMHAMTYKVTCRFKNALIKQHHRGSVGDGYLQSSQGIQMESLAEKNVWNQNRKTA